MGGPLIQMSGVTKLYGPVIGVNDISLALPPGAYGLLGPNAAGKSTLLNLITGQLRPSLGSLRVFGEAPFANETLFRCLGYCPSSEGLYSRVSGLEWVTYLQRLQGMPAAAARRAAEAALELVGMTGAMRREIAGYSRGMRQRTKLAQAMAHDPQFLILDEPFTGLDPVGRHEMTSVLRQWIERGKSLLVASHVLHEVESLTQSFLLICGGRLLASGTAGEVQSLLVDLPNELSIRTNRPHALAERLLAMEAADQVHVDGDRVTIASRVPSRIFAELPQWAAKQDFELWELRSSGESLQSLFTTLLRIHRGEM